MLTNNWYKYFKSVFGSPNTKQLAGVTVKDISGIEGNVYTSDIATYLLPNSGATTLRTAYSGNGFILGDGNDPPTKNDYRLSGNIITTVSKTNHVPSSEVIGDTVRYSCTLVVKNTGTEAITVSEIGWISGCKFQSNKSSYFLMDRTLLESPVTIAPGEEGVIVYKFSSTIPT